MLLMASGQQSPCSRAEDFGIFNHCPVYPPYSCMMAFSSSTTACTCTGLPSIHTRVSSAYTKGRTCGMRCVSFWHSSAVGRANRAGDKVSPWRIPPLHSGDTVFPTRNPLGPRPKDTSTDTHCFGRPACNRKVCPEWGGGVGMRPRVAILHQHRP